MEMKGKKKGLFMTILILILFMLILGELMTFALLTYNYNSLDQASAIGSSSLNYGKALQSSANLFANSSLKSTLTVLANYELNSSMRQGNLVSNTSMYLSYLIINGTLPNVAVNSIAANYLSSRMKNLTLLSYNASVASLLNLGSSSVKINQTKPQISQSSPYTITLSYLESVMINSSSAGKFSYSIPVNATLSLNNTPDLYYYQQGQARNIRFGSLRNITNVIGGMNATNGNYLGMIYGPLYKVPTGAGGLTCASLSAMIGANEPAFSFAPYNQMLIIATSNAIGITNGGSGPNCAAQYGGLITYSINSLSSPPAMPWLLYPSSTSFLTNIINGQHILVFGNTLSSLNIQNLADGVGGGYYFASPFAPSYLDRMQGQVTKQSPNGIFTISDPSLSVANFSFGYINVPNSISINLLGPWTLSTWAIFNKIGAQQPLIEKYDWAPGGGGYALRLGTDGRIYSYIINGASSQPVVSNSVLSAGIWYHITATFNNAGTMQIYINGALDATNSVTMNSISSSTSLKIGARGNDVATRITGMMAGVEIYNQTLSAQQIAQLYQEGISGVPPANSGLAGWWPLNGNANDYSGHSNVGTTTNAFYAFPINYMRDSVLPAVSPTSLSPIPGLLNCNSNAQCSNPLLAHLSLGYLPLGISQAALQFASFNGFGLVSIPSTTTLSPTTALGISAWVYWPVSAVKEMILKNNNANTGVGAYELFQNSNKLSFRLVKAGVSTTVTSTNALGLNAWHHVVGTWDGTTMYVYIDGVQDATTGTVASPIDTTTGQLTFGAYGNLAFPYIGSLANVQIYSNTISANQVKALYAEGISGLPLPGNFIGWWPLNGNANDYSGYSDNGANTNVIYSGFFGTYNAPGLSTISTAANEWQVIGIPRSGG